MKTYENIETYLNDAKQNDYVVLQGYGIMDGLLTIAFKYDAYKVHKIDEKGLLLRRFKGRTNLRIGASYLDQKIGLLTVKEFKNLLT
jgi:hypothetical protein